MQHRILAAQMVYNLSMAVFLIWFFGLNVASIQCCATDAYVYPVNCKDYANSNVKESNVGLAVEVVAGVYFVLVCLSIARCAFTYFVVIRPGARKRCLLSLNAV